MQMAICTLYDLLRMQDFNGHLIQVGQAGCGRRTLTALASFVVHSKLYTVEMRPEYNRIRWREELKDVLHQAGTLGKRATLLVIDSPLFPEVILDNLSHLVKNGEVRATRKLHGRLRGHVSDVGVGDRVAL